MEEANLETIEKKDGDSDFRRQKFSWAAKGSCIAPMINLMRNYKCMRCFVESEKLIGNTPAIY